MIKQEQTELLIKAAKEAGEAILNVYYSDSFNIEIKGDKSPLTQADKEAHYVIESYLKKTPYPILSEEGETITYSERKEWDLFWMVDPLDGTKEFINGKDEFTVNIALIENGKPVFGVVYAPVLDKLYYGGKGIGAFMIHNKKVTALAISKKTRDVTRIVASRSHLNQSTQDFINQFDNTEIVSMGSSLKFMLIAEGEADIYPRFAPTMEWDTAAAHAILNAMNIDVIEAQSNISLKYNKANLLNPSFIIKT